MTSKKKTAYEKIVAVWSFERNACLTYKAFYKSAPE